MSSLRYLYKFTYADDYLEVEVFIDHFPKILALTCRLCAGHQTITDLHLFFSPTSMKCSPSQGSSGEPGVPGLPGAMGLPGFKGHKVRVNSCNYIQKNMVYLSITKS